MHSTLSICDQIHARALEAVSRYKRAESDLIEVLQEADQHRVYLKRGHSSLFKYVTNELRIGENVAYSLITVARKASEVPELKAYIQNGEITLSNARRIVPLLKAQSPETNAQWLKNASTLSNRKLEKEIARVRPELATVEKASYVTENRVRLELGLSEHEMLKLRRVQDLLSQARRRPVSLEESIEALTSEYLKRHDPVEKAKRHQVKKGAAASNAGGLKREVGEGTPSEGKTSSDGAKNPSAPAGELVTQQEPPTRHEREPIPAVTLHQVNLRDHRRCTETLPDGSRCNEARWIDIHHIIHVSQGGTNALENLTTLCSAHHRLRHEKEKMREGLRSRQVA